MIEVSGWMQGGGGRLVTRAKKARSDLRGGQGREPRRPMPRVGVVATIRVRGGRGEGGIEVWTSEGEMDVDISWLVVLLW